MTIKHLSNEEYDFIVEAISKTYTLDEISSRIDLHLNTDMMWNLLVEAYSQRCVELDDYDFECEVNQLSYSEQDTAWSQREFKEE